MNKDLLDEFIKHLEKLMEQGCKSEYVQDGKGCYLKMEYMSNLITEAKELIKYGELKIALENLIENLIEVSVFVDEETANLARQAFGIKISAEIEKMIGMLVNN